MRFLVDECLHKGLVKVAHDAGYEAHHVVDLGKAGAKDFHLRELITKEDFVLVTNNPKDFKRLVAKSSLHPGLVIIVPNVRPSAQNELFKSALEAIAKLPSTINKIIEVWDRHDVRVYDLPALK